MKAGADNKSLAFFAVGVEGANMTTLAKISVRAPVTLKGLAFSELFQWLSASQRIVSRSKKTDEEVPLPPLGWGTV